MIDRQTIFDLVASQTVIANQLSVRTEVVILASVLAELQEITARLTAIEINTMNQGLLHDQHTPVTGNTLAESSAAKPAAK